MGDNRLCKTPGCTNVAIPGAKGYCSGCFERIVKIQQIELMEDIVKLLTQILKEGLNVKGLENKQVTQVVEQVEKHVEDRKIDFDVTDFIPSIDVSDVKVGEPKKEAATTKKEKKKKKSVKSIVNKLKQVQEDK